MTVAPPGGPILVVDTMGGLGDLVLALPIVHALARSHPDRAVHVVTTAPWHVLLGRDPLVASLVPVEGRDEATVRSAVQAALARIRPAIAITTNRQFGLPDLLEAAVPRAVTDLWRNPPADELVDLRSLRLLLEEGLIDPRYAALEPALALDADEVAQGAALLASLAPAGRPVLLFPDSGMAVKRWPLSSWTRAIGALRAAGDAPVVVAEDPALVAALADAGAAPLPTVGLRQLAAVCAAAAARGGSAVGGDTGPVRVATAAGLRAVGLFGPTVASRYGFRGRGSTNVQGLPGCEIRRPTAITEQTCWWSARCPLTGGREPACMADVAPERVLFSRLR